MPVMQYIHEHKDYPLFIHVFPNNEDETAVFELYEDEGTDQGYLRDIYSKTQFVCTTTNEGYSTTVTPDDKGFVQSNNRNIILKYHLESKPEKIYVNNAVVKNVEELRIADSMNDAKSSTEWSWNDTTKECWVKIADKRKSITVTIN